MRKEIGAFILAAAVTACQSSSDQINSKPDISRFGNDAFLLTGDLDTMRDSIIRLQNENCRLIYPYTIVSYSTNGYGGYPTVDSMMVYTSTPSCAPEIK